MNRGTDIDHDDRGVSIAVTHVLTVGITTILVAGLLISAGTMLENERERSAEGSLETIGERLAGEISSVDRIVNDTTDDSVNVTTNHQRRVAGSTYTVEIETNACDTGDHPLIQNDPCLVLTAQSEDVTVGVPLANESRLDGSSSVTGGTIVIEWDDVNNEIQLTDGDS